MQPQCSSDIREQAFSYIEETSMIAPPHCSMQHIPHWQDCNCTGNLDKIGPFGLFITLAAENVECLFPKTYMEFNFIPEHNLTFDLYAQLHLGQK